MPDRSVVTRFIAHVDGYMAGVAKMKAGTEQFVKAASSNVQKNKADWDKLGNAALLSGGAIAAALGLAVKKYSEFEAQMSKVASVTNASARQQEALSKAALKAGQDTVFSATEAAQAQTELAKAGVETSDILGGALRGSLDLAAAGGLDLASSAEIAAQAMNIFNKSGSDVGHIADVLTAGANKSAAGVDDLGMALSQGGLLAKQTGLTLEDTVGVLSAFADNALKGSDAGTSLKTMLQRLTPQSTEQAKAMDALGLSFYDAQGNFVGITETAGRLQKAFADLTPEQRNANLQTIFGSDAVRGANILMEQGEEGIRKYITAVDDQGAAQRMAAKQTDNLKGDIEQLKGAYETAQIQVGEFLRPFVKGATTGLKSLVDGFSGLNQGTQQAIVNVGAVTAGSLLLVGAGAKVLTTLSEVRAAYAATGLAGSRFSGALAAGAKGAAGFVAGLVAINLALDALSEERTFDVADIADSVTRGADPLKALQGELKRTAEVSGFFDFRMKDLNSTLREVFDPSAIDRLQSPFAKILGQTGDIEFANNQLKQTGEYLAALVQNGNASGAAKIFDDLRIQAIGYGKSTDDLLGLLPAYADALDTAKVGASATGGATGDLADKTSLAAGAAADATAAVGDFAKALKDLNQPQLDARESARQVAESLLDIKKEINETNPALNRARSEFDTTTEAGIRQQGMLDDLAGKYNTQIGALAATGASQKTLDGRLAASRTEFIKVATQMGLNGEAAKRLADKILQVPTKRTTEFVAKTGSANAAVDALQSNYQQYSGKTITTYFKAVATGSPTAPYATNLSGLLGVKNKADGGAIYGPGSATSDSIPARLSNGEHVLTASDVQKAGGQGAIYRMRAGIQTGALKFAKGGAVRFAEGGEVDWASILDILQDVTTYDDVRSSRESTASRSATLKSARASLVTMRRQLAAANRAVSAARRTKGRGDDLRALESRRKLLARIEVQEDRVALATSRVTSARRAQTTAEREYSADKRKIIDRSISASSTSNVTSKKFLDNIDKLTRMGFKTLALELLNQGGAEAEGIAAQAVLSATKAKALESQLRTSQSLSQRRDELLGALGGGGSADTVAPQLSWYSQVRDLGKLSPAVRNLPRQAPHITFEIQGLVADPVGTGQAIESALQRMSDTLGQPVRIATAP